MKFQLVTLITLNSLSIRKAAQEGMTLTDEMLKDAKIVAESNPFST